MTDRPHRRHRRDTVDHPHDALTAEEVERLVAEDATTRPNRSRSFGAKRNQRVEDALRARLQPLGHELMFRDDELFVDGEQVGRRLRRKFLGHRDSRDLLSDDDAFGRIVDRYLFVLVRRRAETHLELRARKLYLANARPQPGFKLMKVNKELGHLSARAFSNTAGERVNGRFWAPGPHWGNAALLLVPPDQRPKTPEPARAVDESVPTQSESETVQSGRLVAGPAPRRASGRPPGTAKTTVTPRPPELSIHRWPDSAPEGLTHTARCASEALRERRIRADDFPVEIDCGDSQTLKFEPLRRRQPSGRLELPFQLHIDSGLIRGCVFLRSPNTPLSIGLESHANSIDLLPAWCLVLEVASERYTGEPSDPDVHHSEPVGFHPDLATQQILRHWVSAHMTRLPEGRQARADAAKAADEFEIELPAGYTWRKGHWRGGKGRATLDGTPLRYTWRPRRR